MKLLLIIFCATFIYACAPGDQQLESYDVLVVGGGASGTTAGIQSARLGTSTLIVEETSWLGGMLTSAGVSAIDGNYKLYSGLWQEFRERIYTHYGGKDSVKTGWVSNVLFEPNVGADILYEMAREEGEKLSIWFESKVVSLEYVDNFWRARINVKGVEKLVKAEVIVDGTELGDISKMAGIPYDIGMDSRYETGEEIAPEESNDIVQDLTYVAVLKDYGQMRRLMEKPDGYDPSRFYCTCAGKCNQDTISRMLWPCEQMMRYGKLPNNKYMINWPISGNDFYANTIELDPKERKVVFEKAKWFTKCYIYYLQQELGFEHLGVADDVFPTKDGFPFFPYHRESRRIRGLVRFDINDLAKPFEQKDALYLTGIAVGDYPVDHHHEAYPESKELPDLHFYPVPSYSLPLGTLIPQNVKGFVVAEKSISVTNIVNGTTRLQPVCLLIGQAAGALAHLSVQHKVTPQEIPVRDVQKVLLQQGAYIMPYSDINRKDPAFKAIQRIGATGILKGEGKNVGWENHTFFHPDSVLTYAALIDGINDFDDGFDTEINSGSVTIGQALKVIENLMKYLHETDAIRDKDQLVTDVDPADVWSDFQLGVFDENEAITRKQFSVLLDRYVDPFRIRQIDHHGLYLN